MNVRKYLFQAYTATERIAEISKQIRQLKDDMTRLGGDTIGGVRVQASLSHDPMGDRLAKIIDKITGREKQLARWQDILCEVNGVLNGIECATFYKVLHARYVRGLSMDAIADELGYSLHWTRKLHAAGVASIKL